jgi:hypothetical protein
VSNVKDRAPVANTIAANSRASYTAVSDQPLKISISADEQYELYVNGSNVGSNSGWNSAETYEVQTTMKENIIAIKALNQKDAGGLVAQIEYGNERYVTNEKWKISKTEQSNWSQFDFNDSSWLKATSLGFHGTAEPWAQHSNVSGISTTSGVKWIWSADSQNDNIVYFRFVIRPGGDLVPPNPPTGVVVTGQ